MPATLTRKNEFQFVLNFLFVQNFPSRDYVYIRFNGSEWQENKISTHPNFYYIQMRYYKKVMVMIKAMITLSGQDTNQIQKN